MSRKMLIDAGHPEETRVVVVDSQKVEEFDFESQARRQLRGNIYLARVTRVEPSLQAAFVEYGGNRHGFLSFNEIHPDYYQIPYEDRQKLLAEAQREAEKAVKEDDDAGDVAAEAADSSDDEAPADAPAEPIDDEEDAVVARARRAFQRRYKIQEVIKRRQILLVQVVKEERGNKGAALTTFLSLAGRYCVLMPNTARGGGISRKITSATDRKRLKKIAGELEVPDGMGLIVRTAGAKRTKSELKRDYEYLLRLWETIREDTLKSVAPCRIYEESNLVKRAVRDMYDKDIDEILIEGESAYREAKDFMRMLMPSHAKKVQHYKDATPVFIKQRVEDQLEQIYEPIVQLKSGGYIVINQTEALVAIDVNSGRSTRERNIEATALKTNLEAAEEACRQMRLRDLAGLIVIDFIDMEESKNNRSVEKKMRDSLKRDRARVQTSKISMFGLMEMSRQRRRASIIEGSTEICRTCDGRGLVRSVESSALHLLRRVEKEGLRGAVASMRVRVAPKVALYVLNEKREHLNAIEERCRMRVLVEADDTLVPPTYEIDHVETRSGDDAELEPAPAPAVAREREREPEPDAKSDEDGGEGDGKKRRRRRRRRSRGERTDEARTDVSDDDDDAAPEVEAEPDAGDAREPASAVDGDDEEERPKRRRRRGRRGGRGRRREATTGETANGETANGETDEPDAMRVVDPESADPFVAEVPVEPAPAPSETEATSDDVEIDKPEKPKRTRRRRKPAATAAEAPLSPADVETADSGDAVEKPKPRRKTAAKTTESTPSVVDTEAEAEPADAPGEVAVAEVAAEAGPDSVATAAEDPEAEERRKRWQDRLKTWLNN